MRRITAKNTEPEMVVRRLLHSLGYRYRLHAKDLPGKPDIVFLRRKKVIFVHGCFWHQHEGCRGGRAPATRQGYWAPKLHRNIERDAENMSKLLAMGWDVCVVWECELKGENALLARIQGFLARE
jgi:DNA mismatch endonuclease (patch repair protein)